MEGKGRSSFIDWGIYGLGVLSIAVLIYLFVGRYGTKIVISQPEKPINNIQLIPVPRENQPLPPKTETVPLDLKESKDLLTPVEPVVPQVQKKKNLKKQAITRSKSKSRPPKKLSKKRRCQTGICAVHKKRAATNLSRYICVPSRASKANYKKIRGFTLFKRHITVSSKNYNWTVLNRYPLKVKKNLKKIGAYRVQRGDTVYSIARQFGVRAIDIMAINLQINNPDRLKVRSKIFIPEF